MLHSISFKYQGMVGLISSFGLILTGCQIQSSEWATEQLNAEPTAIHLDTQPKAISTSRFETTDANEKVQNWVHALCDEENSSVMSRFLNEVNESVLSFLAHHQVKIKRLPQLEDYHSGYSETYGEVEGVYLPKTNQILFLDQDEQAFKELLDQQFYHEAGHAVDTLLGDLAMTEEFQLLFQEGANIIFSEETVLNDYYRENVWEYFAESFNLFFKNPAQLALHEPTYKYICEVVEQLQQS